MRLDRPGRVSSIATMPFHPTVAIPFFASAEASNHQLLPLSVILKRHPLTSGPTPPPLLDMCMLANSCLLSATASLSIALCYTRRTPCLTHRCVILGVTRAPPARGGRALQAAREHVERVILVAVATPALRLAAAQHRGALVVRSAQAGLQVAKLDELCIAGLHAAHARAKH